VPFNRALGTFIGSTEGHALQVGRLAAIEQEAIAYCDELAARPGLADYDVFGFSSSTGQNTASLALAKRLKDRFPDKIIAYGGANADGAMGPQLVRSFSFVDYAFAGEGDVSFPPFLEALAEGRPVDVPGVYSRANASPAEGVRLEAPMRLDMNALPYPDFSDWFDAFAAVPGGEAYQMSLPVEGSRGCWWGAKHHCTFCGLNGTTMAYRAKTPERFRDEVDHLVRRWGIKSVMATDNILDPRWPRQLAPLLKEKRAYDVLFFEIKANLSKADLELLADAGITHMNPGIESFSTHVLQLMDKGSNALQNIQLLNWAEELGVTLQYCFISGFPGETEEDYADIADVLPKIVHLKPGKSFSRISIDRFSPYFNQPGKYGMRLDTCPAYRYVFDLPDEEIAGLAYWYYSVSATGSSRESLGPPEYARRVAQLHRIWQSLYGRVSLRYRLREDGRVEIEDTRPIATAAEHVLDPLESALFLHADAAIRLPGLRERLRREERWAGTSDAEIAAALERLEARFLVHREGDRYVALAPRDTGIPRRPVMAEVKLSPRTD
jgi:ribosomal peptide maturation radical SAM protein 1